MDAEIAEIANQYEDQLCPDCGEDIPLDAQYEEECLNCGHVWNRIQDDEPFTTLCEENDHLGKIETYENEFNRVTSCNGCGDILSVIPLKKD